MPRLFRLKSFVNNLSHKGSIYDGVEVFWLVVYRDNWASSQEQLTNGFIKNSDNSPFISEENLYELFSEEESNVFKEYLYRTHNKQGCEIRETHAQVEIEAWGYGDRAPGHKEGFYRIDVNDSYNLPFVVWGYYDVTHAKDVSWLVYGVESIEMVLDKFGITVTDINKLKTTIEDLKNNGLFVERHINIRERLTY
jgi:hypothetical protein